MASISLRNDSMANLMRKMLCASLDGKGLGGRMDKCICMAESHQSSPETVTTLLIGYSSVQIILLLKKLIKINFFLKEKFVWHDKNFVAVFK